MVNVYIGGARLEPSLLLLGSLSTRDLAKVYTHGSAGFSGIIALVHYTYSSYNV